MHDVATVSRLLHEGWPTGSVKERIRTAARALHWSPTRTRDLWYGQARRVDAHEMQRLATIKNIRARAHDAIAERNAHDARVELDRALALVASHLAAEAAQGDRNAAHALREIASRINLAGGLPSD